MEIRNGLFFQLTDDYSSKVLFSAATDIVDEDTFIKLWTEVGRFVFKNQEKDHDMRLRFTATPIRDGLSETDEWVFINL